MSRRAEMRRQIKAEKKKKNTYNMSVAELETMRKRSMAHGVERGTDQAIVLLLAIPLKVMYDKYGWRSRKRLPEFCDAITDEYQRFIDGGYKDIFEYADFVEEVTGGRYRLNTE